MLYRFYGKDANRSSVPFLDLWSIHNESNGSWEKATTTLVDIYGEHVDNDDTIFIDDAQKGLGAALKKVMMNSATFICERHLAADVTLRFGSAGSQAFYLLARATRMDEFSPQGFKFIDSERNRGRFDLKKSDRAKGGNGKGKQGEADRAKGGNGNGKLVTRMVPLAEDEPSCECGAPEVQQFPCACLIYAAQKKGIDPAVFLDDHDTMVTWKLQYEDLPTYNIPGNEAIRLLPPDDLAPLPPVTYPQKPGRPTIARIKGALEKSRKFKKSSSLAAATGEM